MHNPIQATAISNNRRKTKRVRAKKAPTNIRGKPHKIREKNFMKLLNQIYYANWRLQELLLFKSIT